MCVEASVKQESRKRLKTEECNWFVEKGLDNGHNIDSTLEKDQIHVYLLLHHHRYPFE